jgi:hypothetical protein
MTQAAMSPAIALAQLKSRQNFGRAVPAGLAAALVGAALWAVTVYATNMKLGLIAVVIGAFVGYAIRVTGNGIDQKFGVLGAAYAALGWALGTVAGDVAFVAQYAHRPIPDVVASLGLERIASLAFNAADAMDIVFLAIAIYEGYRFSFRYRLKRR